MKPLCAEMTGMFLSHRPSILLSVCVRACVYMCVCVRVQHLGCAVPDCVELQEMICESCMNKHLFLWTYAAHLAGTVAPPTERAHPSVIAD